MIAPFQKHVGYTYLTHTLTLPLLTDADKIWTFPTLLDVCVVVEDAQSRGRAMEAYGSLRVKVQLLPPCQQASSPRTNLSQSEV